MTVQEVILIAALLCLSIGVLRDIARSEADKEADSGVLGGTFRPVSWAGFLRGVPWYLAGALLLAMVAWDW